MPVEGVDIVEREHVDKLLHRVGREEVTRHIEVRAAVAEAGRVVDSGGGDAAMAENPTMAFIGVRMSWDMLFRNADLLALARLAVS